MSSILRLAALAAFAAQTDALYWLSTPRYDYYSSYYMREPDEQLEPSPHWRVSRDAYELKVRLPELEPTSVKAALGVDGTKVEVSGERKIEGCTCQPSMVKEIALPFRPRPEDVDVSYDKDGVLSMRLLRQPAKAEATTPLTVSVTSATDKADPTPAEAETRKLRFVPHESAQQQPSSATVTSLDEQEKNLTNKFRAAAQAAVAVQHDHGEPSAREAAAATAEGAADATASEQPVEPGHADAPKASA